MAHKLARRTYLVPGPNYISHIDIYGKLKANDLCIHCAIDGHSRRMIWLEVGLTNNNQKMIAQYQYYLHTNSSHGFMPRFQRSDPGTEHSNTCVFETVFIAACGWFIRVRNFTFSRKYCKSPSGILPLLDVHQPHIRPFGCNAVYPICLALKTFRLRASLMRNYVRNVSHTVH